MKTYPEILVDNLIDDGYQTLALEYGLKTGDISPIDSIHLDEIKKELADIFSRHIINNGGK